MDQQQGRQTIDEANIARIANLVRNATAGLRSLMRAGDFAAAHQLLDDAQAGWEQGGYDPDTLLALRYYIAHYRRIVRVAEAGGEFRRAHFDELQAALLQEPVGRASETHQARMLIIAKTNGCRRGFCEFPPAEFRRYFERYPQVFPDDEFWFYVTSWSLIHGDREVLEECYSYALTHAGGDTSDYIFQRTRLVHKLVTGNATEEDVTGLISQISHPNILREFENFLLPYCRERGLAGEAVDEALAFQWRALRELDEQQPGG